MAERRSERRLRLGMVGGGPDAFIGAVHRIAARLAAPMQPGIILDVTVAGHDGGQLLAA